MTEKTDSIVSKAIRQLKETPDSFISLSTGIILKPVRVPNMIFPEIMSRFEQPKVPRVFVEDLGREEENPSDPDYISATNTYQVNLSKAIVDTMIILGTEVHSIPEGMDDEAGSKWLKKLKVLNINPGDDEVLRYLYWVKFYAAPSEEDIQKIMEGVGQLTGVSETEVKEAVSQFRDNPER
jgi:hypothetical protein